MKTALEECMEDGRHYHTMWKAAEAREATLRAEVERLRAALQLTRPALVTWDDYAKGTVWCCCCDREIGALPPTDCPHGAACPVVLVDEVKAR